MANKSKKLLDTTATIIPVTVNPDNSTTELGWSSNTAPPGAPSGAFTNPYPQYTALTIPLTSGSVAKGTNTAQDVNGNTTSVGEYDWFAPSGITRNNGFITGLPGSPLRTTSTTYYSA